MDQEDNYFIIRSWGNPTPRAWRNFVRSLQHDAGGIDPWLGLSDVNINQIIEKSLLAQGASRVISDAEVHEVIFKTPAHKTMFMLRWDGPEEFDPSLLFYAPYIPLI